MLQPVGDRPSGCGDRPGASTFPGRRRPPGSPCRSTAATARRAGLVDCTAALTINPRKGTDMIKNRYAALAFAAAITTVGGWRPRPRPTRRADRQARQLRRTAKPPAGQRIHTPGDAVVQVTCNGSLASSGRSRGLLHGGPPWSTGTATSASTPGAGPPTAPRSAVDLQFNLQREVGFASRTTCWVVRRRHASHCIATPDRRTTCDGAAVLRRQPVAALEPSRRLRPAAPLRSRQTMNGVPAPSRGREHRSAQGL